MPYLSSIERLAKKEGLAEGRKKDLWKDVKKGRVPHVVDDKAALKVKFGSAHRPDEQSMIGQGIASGYAHCYGRSSMQNRCRPFAICSSNGSRKQSWHSQNQQGILEERRLSAFARSEGDISMAPTPAGCLPTLVVALTMAFRRPRHR